MFEAAVKLSQDSAGATINGWSSVASLSSRGLPAAATRLPPPAAGWQCQGALWSDLNALCTLLRVSCSADLTSCSPLFQHRRYRSGQRIHTTGQPFDTLFAVHSGFLKTMIINDFDDEHVLRFPMRGDLFGVDGIHTGRHSTEAVALTDCVLVLIPFREFNALVRSHAGMEDLVYTLLSRELQSEQALISMLGSLNAEAKVARFLVSLSDRFIALGYSGKQFNLRMGRNDIGSHLGLTLETVSRTLSALQACGLIAVQRRSISLIDIDALRSLRQLPLQRPERVETILPRVAA
jgi:CRP/FNR family transcriptional regulator